MAAVVLFMTFFLVLLILVLIQIYSSSIGDTEQIGEPIIHRFYEYNHQTKKASSGLLWLMNEEASSFSYEPTSETYSLISSFEMTEYQCTGSCYCDNERKSAGSTSSKISSGLIFFVASLSSIFAYEKASEYFESFCENEEVFEGEKCFTQVLSAVDDCEEIKEEEAIPTENTEATRQKDMKDKYECFGRCVPVEEFQAILQYTEGYEEAEKKQKKLAEKKYKKHVKKEKCLLRALSVKFTVDEILQPLFTLYSPDPKESLEGADLQGHYQIIKNVRSGNKGGEKAAISYFLNHYMMPLCIEARSNDLGTPLCEPWKGFYTDQEPNFAPKLNPSVKCVKFVDW